MTCPAYPRFISLRTLLIGCAIFALTGCDGICGDSVQTADDTGLSDTEPPLADAATDDADSATGDANSTTGDADTGPSEMLDDSKLDLLWVIDNSGTMCRSQEVVRENIETFTQQIKNEGIDFHMGITTTHMVDCDDPTNASLCEREPVAQAGHLQATPQPVPGFGQFCIHSVYRSDDPEVDPEDPDAPDPGDPIIESIGPVVANLKVAVSCTENPSNYQHVLDFDETRLRCSIPGEPGVESGDCDNLDDELEDFFPPPDSYRDIPVVMRSEDYTDPMSGEFDIDAFKSDFTCASLVGTRGHGFEKGLSAAVTALSPQLTGGPESTVEDSDQYPNAGFIRPSAHTSVIFVSDENDCSDDGTLDETTFCGVHNCTIEENQGDDGALLSIESLHADFVENLSASKGLTDLDETSIRPASIHASYQKPDPASIPDACSEDPADAWRIDESCPDESIFPGWSGHRYEYFLREFPSSYPPADSEEPLEGLICGDFSSPLIDIAEFIVP